MDTPTHPAGNASKERKKKERRKERRKEIRKERKKNVDLRILEPLPICEVFEIFQLLLANELIWSWWVK
jgi:hypothetical protein